LSAPEPALLPRDATPGAPVFGEPWHAEVLGIANALIRGGMFSSTEWANELGAEIRRRGEASEPDTETTYYYAALGALERLVGEKSPATGGSLLDRVEAWRRAYLNTPHGQPVTLAAAALPRADHDHHDHDHH
jgi:nitrile hydratase accessory protein